MNAHDAAIYGFIGGALAEFYGLYTLRHLTLREFPAYYRLWSYWVLTVGMMAIGAGLAWLYANSAGVKLNVLLAVNVGASAPLILRSAVRGTVPPGPGGPIST